MATVDLGKISFTQKGTWNSGTAYVAKDVVQYEDDRELSSYVAIASSTNQAPSTNGTVNTTYWALFAKGTSMASHNQGTYNAATAYQKGDIIQYTDSAVLSTYLAIADSTGQTPSTGGTVNSSYWAFVAKGTASVAISYDATPKTANFTAASASGYFVDTNGGQVTVTTPASPSTGDEFILIDLRGTFGINQLNLAPNGSDKIKGSTEIQNIKENYASTRIVYSGATYGWLPVSSSAVTTEPIIAAYDVDYLSVAGGGGGGNDTNDGSTNNSAGGGGGGGGFRTGTFQLRKGTQYTITVGAGGAGSSTPNTTAPNGTASSIVGGSITITSAGGGGGGGETKNGADGGCGGGGGWGNDGPDGTGGAGNTPAVSPSQGFNGQDGQGSNGYGGGGGGASEAGGTDGVSAGGDGTSSSITGTAITYAGGGGGGSGGNTISPAALGGGGTGSTGTGNNGTDGLGGGGGGGGSLSGIGGGPGGNGGDGVVILRMLTTDYSSTTTGSPTVTTDGLYKVIKYTASGTYTA